MYPKLLMAAIRNQCTKVALKTSDGLDGTKSYKRPEAQRLWSHESNRQA